MTHRVYVLRGLQEGVPHVFMIRSGNYDGHGISSALDSLAKLYRRQLAKVKVAGTLSERFSVKKEVRQGCVLSPYLFNILAEMVMRETLDGFQGGLQIAGRTITNIRYADDIILSATSEAELQELMDRLDRLSRRYSLLINIDKTKKWRAMA